MKKYKLIIVTLFLFVTASCGNQSRKQNTTAKIDEMNIGFVRLDSLTKLYDYHGVLVKEIEAKAKKMEAELIRSQQNIQTEYEVLQQAAPNLSKIFISKSVSFVLSRAAAFFSTFKAKNATDPGAPNVGNGLACNSLVKSNRNL